jgi:hypothetical protein
MSLVKPYENLTVDNTSWTELTAPDYAVSGYKLSSRAGAGFYVSDDSAGATKIYVPDTAQPKPKALENTETGTSLEYIQSEIASDTIDIEWVL